MTDPEFDVREVRESKVSYSTKELLERIDKRFERLEDLAHGMASRVDVDAVSVRVAVLEKEAIEVRAVAQALLTEKKERFSKKEKVVGAVFALVTLALNVLALAPDIIG